MKKFISIILSLVLLLSSIQVVFANNDITVKIDGQQIAFDVPPQLINGRTMVPLRAIFESLGATVEWNNNTQTVTSARGNTIISLTIDNTTMYVNGVAKPLDTPACLISGRTLVPVRAISEAFGCDVQWDGTNNSVIITSSISKKSNANLANDGHFVFANGWVYYCKDSKIYKMKTDGTNKQIIYNDYATSLNLVNDWLYFVSKNKINKIKTDGTEMTVLTSINWVYDCMVVDGNKIYYVDESCVLSKANLDGSNITRIGYVTTLFFQVEGDWIYYNPEISPSGLTFGNICRIKTDGTQQSKIIDSSTYDFNVVDGWIYYDNSEYQNSGIFKARIDGSGKKKLAEKKEITAINVIGEWIYYFTYYDLYSDPIQGELRKVDLNGQNDTFVKKYNFCIYYIGTADNIVVCDGVDNSDIALINDTNSNIPVQNGFGTLYDVLGKREYEGDLKNGEPNGNGIVFYEDGYTKFYEGQFKDGVPYGKGIIYYKDGCKKYEGELPSGTGTFYEEETERIYYIGQHKDMVHNGKGTYYNDDGKYYIGEFKNGQFHGQGTIYNKDGSIIVSGVFENNELISENKQNSSSSSGNYTSYQQEYDVLIEWGNQKVQEISAEAQKIYNQTYDQALETETKRYFPNYDNNSNMDSYAAANMQRQLQALMPTIKKSASQSAELASKAYEANELERLVAFLQDEIAKLKQKYNTR